MKIISQIPRIIKIKYILIFNILIPYITKNKIFKKNIGKNIRVSFENLGPIFVKFGQLLSTRIDLLPKGIVTELTKLQDKVPPFCSKKAKLILQKSLNLKIEEVFIEFDSKPLASASMAQVHAAKLKTGEEIVIKILRPKIKKQIQKDIYLLELLTKIVKFFVPMTKRFKLTELVIEFKKSIFNELDLIREGANASQLRRNFINSDTIYIPKIYWEYSNTDILVMERVYGIPISNIKKLKAENIDLKYIAKIGVEIFFTQAFRDCFFHADLHPGNIWVDNSNPKNIKLILLDFGIVGTLSPEDQHYLAANFLAFFKKDYKKVANLHVESGWVPNHIRINEFESEIRYVCEPIFERPIKEVSFGTTLLKLLKTAEKFDMNIQPQFLLLQKTLVNVEGLGRQLAPDLDLWNTARPFLEKWMKDRTGIKHILKEIKNNIPFWLEKFPEMSNINCEINNKKYNTENCINNNYNSYKLNNFYKSTTFLLIGIITGFSINHFLFDLKFY